VLLDFRQGTVFGKRFIKPNKNTVDLTCGHTPLCVTVSNGDDNYFISYTQNITAAWNIKTTGLVYLYIDINNTTKKRSFGYTNLPLYINANAPTSPAVGQNWYDLTNNIIKEYTGGTWNPTIRAFVGEYNVLNNNIIEYGHGSQVGIQSDNNIYPASLLSYDDTGKLLTTSDGQLLTIDQLDSSLGNNSVLVSPITNLSKGTVVKIVDSSKCQPITSADVGNAIIGVIVAEGFVEKPVTCVMNGVVSLSLFNWNVPSGSLLWVDETSQLTLISVNVLNQTRGAPVAVVLSSNTVYFCQQIKGNNTKNRTIDENHVHTAADLYYTNQQDVEDALHAIDDTKISITGGTVTGNISLPDTPPTNPLQSVNISYVDTTKIEHLDDVAFGSPLPVSNVVGWDGEDWTNLPVAEEPDYKYNNIIITPTEITNGISFNTLQYELLSLHISDSAPLLAIADSVNCIGFITVSFDNLFGDKTRTFKMICTNTGALFARFKFPSIVTWKDDKLPVQAPPITGFPASIVFEFEAVPDTTDSVPYVIIGSWYWALDPNLLGEQTIPPRIISPLPDGTVLDPSNKFYYNNPVILSNSLGHLFVFFYETLSATVYFKKSIDKGLNWTETSISEISPGVSTNPMLQLSYLITPNDDIYVIIRDESSPDQIYLTKSTDDGDTWSSAALIHTAADPITDITTTALQYQASSGTFAIVYSTGDFIYGITSPDAVTWSSAIALTDGLEILNDRISFNDEWSYQFEQNLQNSTSDPYPFDLVVEGTTNNYGTTPSTKGIKYDGFNTTDIVTFTPVIGTYTAWSPWPQVNGDMSNMNYRIISPSEGLLWDFQEVSPFVPPNPNTWPVPVGGWTSNQPGNFGRYPSTYTPPPGSVYDTIQTTVDRSKFQWIQRTFTITATEIVFVGKYENGFLCYIDGVYAGGGNQTNTNWSEEYFVFDYILRIPITPGTHTVAFYIMNEIPPPSETTDNVFFSATIAESTPWSASCNIVATRASGSPSSIVLYNNNTGGGGANGIVNGFFPTPAEAFAAAQPIVVTGFTSYTIWVDSTGDSNLTDGRGGLSFEMTVDYVDRDVTILQYPLNLSAVTNAGVGYPTFSNSGSPAAPGYGVTVAGFQETDQIIISSVRAKYSGYSLWNSNGANAGNDWLYNLCITDNTGFTYESIGSSSHYLDGVAALNAAKAAGPIILTGATSYTFYIKDTTPLDNRGGLSLKIEKRTPTNTAVLGSPATISIPVTGWLPPEPAPFGHQGTGLAFQYPVQTAWPVNSNLWIKNTVMCEGYDLVVSGSAENAALVYFDGQYVGGSNPSNSDNPTIGSPVFADMFVNQFDFNALNATVDGGTTEGVHRFTVSGFDEDDICVVSWPSGRLYEAMKFDAPNAWYTPLRYNTNITGLGFSSSIEIGQINSPIFLTASDALTARQEVGEALLTGATSYIFWIYDIDATNNVGGVSVSIHKRKKSNLNDAAPVPYTFTISSAIATPGPHEIVIYGLNEIGLTNSTKNQTFLSAVVSEKELTSNQVYRYPQVSTTPDAVAIIPITHPVGSPTFSTNLVIRWDLDTDDVSAVSIQDNINEPGVDGGHDILSAYGGYVDVALAVVKGYGGAQPAGKETTKIVYNTSFRNTDIWYPAYYDNFPVHYVDKCIARKVEVNNDGPSIHVVTVNWENDLKNTFYVYYSYSIDLATFEGPFQIQKFSANYDRDISGLSNYHTIGRNMIDLFIDLDGHANIVFVEPNIIEGGYNNPFVVVYTKIDLDTLHLLPVLPTIIEN